VLITLIAAMAENRVIGRGNAMPWHLPADLRHFKSLTLGKPVLMGRKTFASLGKPLPGRTNLVLTRDAGFSAAGVQVVHSLDEAIVAAGDAAELMVIGGGDLYRQAMARATQIHLTIVHTMCSGDTCFPELPAGEWREVARREQAPDEKNPVAMSFTTLTRAP
jgi:dihydrofolate reductase